MEIAGEVLARLADPASIFDPDRAPSVDCLDSDGKTVALRDTVSYESGACGVLLLATLLDDREVAREYSRWIEGQLTTALNHKMPGALNALLGADIAAHLSPPDSGMARLAMRTRNLLHKKTDFEIASLERSIGSGRGSPGFWASDVLAGLGRSLIILTNSTDKESSDRITRGADVLRRLLVPDREGMVGYVAGPPFYGRAGDDLESHWNLGFAHGSSGIAFALVRVGEFLRRENRSSEEVRISVRNYCDWIHARFDELEVPMYAHDLDGSPRFVSNGAIPSWCYGTTGHSLLMFAAGNFLEDSSIINRGIEGALLSTERVESLADYSLCHGLAGVLAMITAGRAVSDDSRLERAQKLVRDRIVASFSTQSRYGFDYTPPGIAAPSPVPGLLNGAAGVAAALWQSNSRTSTVDGTPWLCAPRVAFS